MNSNVSIVRLNCPSYNTNADARKVQENIIRSANHRVFTRLERGERPFIKYSKRGDEHPSQYLISVLSEFSLEPLRRSFSTRRHITSCHHIIIVELKDYVVF